MRDNVAEHWGPEQGEISDQIQCLVSGAFVRPPHGSALPLAIAVAD
jgi:hypothetical protein